MRITLTIDDDVWAAVRDIARSQSKTIGDVASELARASLQEDGILAPSPGEVIIADTLNGLHNEFP